MSIHRSTARPARSRPTRAPRLLVTLLALAALPASAAAQQDGRGWTGFWSQVGIQVDVLGQAAIPAGDFANHMQAGGGLTIAGVLSPDESSPFALRLEFAGSAMGDDRGHRDRAPEDRFTPGGWPGDFWDDIWDGDWDGRTVFASVVAGPQVYLADGPIRPYLFGGIGASFFETGLGEWGTDWPDDDGWDDDRRRGRDHDWDEDWDDDGFDIAFDEAGLAVSAAAGVALEIYRDVLPISLDLSASYGYHGSVPLLDGDIFDERRDAGRRFRRDWWNCVTSSCDQPPDPREYFVAARSISTPAHLVSLRLGVSIAVF